MRTFSLKLRKILLCDLFFYLLLLITIIYLILSIKLYELDHLYNISNTNFMLTIKDIKTDGDKLSLEFKENLIGTYYFNTINEKEYFINNINIGDKLSIDGSLNIPNNNTIPNTFNYKKYLYHKNIEYTLSIKEYKLIEKNKSIFIKIKNYFYKRINNIDNDYLYAFILGKSSYIDGESYNNYKINGVTHLFALSGLHVSLFSSIILSILTKLKMNEKLKYLLTSLFLIFFSFIASFTPSILRATIFFILSSVNTIYYFYIKPKNILYLTFIILIFINPNYIYNTGFILSFTITFFILLFNESFKINNNILSILVISVVSFLSSLPIIINMSYEINIIGFINNLFFIPFVSYIVFPLSLLTLIINKLNPILLFFITIMEKVSFYSSKIFNICLYIQKLTILEIIIYYVLLILIIKNKKKYILPLLILILFIIIKPSFNNTNKVYFIDVGQGDSSLIVTKNNKSILIDTGGKISYEKEEWKKHNRDFNLMINTMIPFFKSIGLKKIDYLILSHGDYDHMGEAINLINNYKVKNVIFNCGQFNDSESKLITLLDDKKIKYYSCLKELDLDNINLYFLNTKEYNNENDYSSVVYTEIDNNKFLFMGDASITTEKEILKKYNLKDIDLLKVGHHGSKTSSGKELINEINPQYSIISVGKNNKFGHPNKEVLDNLENSKIYRTDRDGSIMFKIKNNKLKIDTCSP